MTAQPTVLPTLGMLAATSPGGSDDRAVGRLVWARCWATLCWPLPTTRTAPRRVRDDACAPGGRDCGAVLIAGGLRPGAANRAVRAAVPVEQPLLIPATIVSQRQLTATALGLSSSSCRYRIGPLVGVRA